MRTAQPKIIENIFPLSCMPMMTGSSKLGIHVSLLKSPLFQVRSRKGSCVYYQNGNI